MELGHVRDVRGSDSPDSVWRIFQVVRKTARTTKNPCSQSWMGGVKGQFPQPFKDMGFLRSQERLPNDIFGWAPHAVFKRLGPQKVHTSRSSLAPSHQTGVIRLAFALGGNPTRPHNWERLVQRGARSSWLLGWMQFLRLLGRSSCRSGTGTRESRNPAGHRLATATYVNISRLPLGSGIASPDSRAVSLHSAMASWACLRAAS